jgi:hypothetical protein
MWGTLRLAPQPGPRFQQIEDGPGDGGESPIPDKSGMGTGTGERPHPRANRGRTPRRGPVPVPGQIGDGPGDGDGDRGVRALRLSGTDAPSPSPDKSGTGTGVSAPCYYPLWSQWAFAGLLTSQSLSPGAGQSKPASRITVTWPLPVAGPGPLRPEWTRGRSGPGSPHPRRRRKDVELRGSNKQREDVLFYVYRGKTPVGLQKGNILPKMGSGSFSMLR